MSNTPSKWFRRNIAGAIKDFRRQVRSYFRDPVCAVAFCRFRKILKKRDWLGAKKLLYPLAQRAIKGKNHRLISELGFSAERLGDHESATNWAIESARIQGFVAHDHWDGCNLEHSALCIHFMESEKQGLATGLKMSCYVWEAATKAMPVYLVVERRLVDIFTRTLPGIQVIPFPESPPVQINGPIISTNCLGLKRALGTSEAKIAERYRPLLADPSLQVEFRRKYRDDRALPVVGISWWSSHFGKDLPSISLWQHLVGSIQVTFVNAQYAASDDDLEALGSAAPSRFITDDSVDQLEDMDRFAAQLGSFDLLISISNTGAHLAGAMGVPTILIRDDWFRRAWPVLSDRTPWYPHTIVIGKDGRTWNQLFDELIDMVGKRLAQLDRAS